MGIAASGPASQQRLVLLWSHPATGSAVTRFPRTSLQPPKQSPGQAIENNSIERQARTAAKERNLRMPATFPKEFVVSGLNELRQGMERSKKIYEELARAAQNARIKEALEARVLISAQNLCRLDECFKLINEKPAEVSPHEHELFIQDLREELDQIESPDASKMFVL